VRDCILRLVCGLIWPARENRPFVVLEAYIDDSKTDGQVLVMSGYLASAERWALFSDEWRALLDELGLPRFKMSQLKWSQPNKADEYAERFYRIIEAHAVYNVSSIVELQVFQSACDEMKMPSRYKSPYFLAFWAIVDGLAKKTNLAVRGPVNFIFDKQDEIVRPIRDGWDEYLGEARPEVRQFFGSDPRFESDDDFLPLQAADLDAWCVRTSWHRQGALIDPMPIYMGWKRKVEIPHLIIPVLRTNIVSWLARAKRGMVTELFQWRLVDDPNLPLEYFDFSNARVEK
jgi:hypothetical protein